MVGKGNIGKTSGKDKVPADTVEAAGIFQVSDTEEAHDGRTV